MKKRIFFILFFAVMFLHPIKINAGDFKYIEIFDPKQDKVVKGVQSNAKIQHIITSWITKIDGIYKNDPATDDGYVVKIPLDPAVKVNSKALNTLVREVYILIPEHDMPCYLIFEDENKLSSFVFNGEIDILCDILDFKLRR